MDENEAAQAKALIQRLEEALRRTVAASPTCPYCDTPTYLRRHHDRCGIRIMLEDAKAWLEKPGLS